MTTVSERERRGAVMLTPIIFSSRTPLYDDSTMDRSGRSPSNPLRLEPGRGFSVRERILHVLAAFPDCRSSVEIARGSRMDVDTVWRCLCCLEGEHVVTRRLCGDGRARWTLVRP